MLLEYETTLPDLAEAHTRLFLRSDTFKKHRVYFSLGSAITFIAFLFFFSDNVDSSREWAGAILIAVILAIVCFLVRKKMVSHSIFKYIEREYGDALPFMTQFTVSEQQLACSSRDVGITFSLDDLENVIEDDEYVEMSFGNRGLCVVPLRAFESESHKSNFLSVVRRA
jgi:hypothetical protein